MATTLKPNSSKSEIWRARLSKLHEWTIEIIGWLSRFERDAKRTRAQIHKILLLKLRVRSHC